MKTIYLVFKYGPDLSYYRNTGQSLDGWTFTGKVGKDYDQPTYVKAFTSKEDAEAELAKDKFYCLVEVPTC